MMSTTGRSSTLQPPRAGNIVAPRPSRCSTAWTRASGRVVMTRAMRRSLNMFRQASVTQPARKFMATE